MITCPICRRKDSIISEVVEENYLGKNLTITWQCYCDNCHTRFVQDEHYRYCYDTITNIKYEGDNN